MASRRFYLEGLSRKGDTLSQFFSHHLFDHLVNFSSSQSFFNIFLPIFANSGFPHAKSHV